jgi:hypothetical protein
MVPKKATNDKPAIKKGSKQRQFTTLLPGP